MNESKPLVLVTGATGYVGGRLGPVLRGRGYPLRCIARRPDNLRSRVGPGVEVVGADLLKADSLPPALDGVHTAYYLIHSLGSGPDFEAREEACARHFASASRTAGLSRIIYLGGLGNSSAELSPHLRSRQRVGEILAASGIPTVELRASIVIGSGSLSFEMIRALVDRLPVMVTPRWVGVRAQPIAISDLLAYLIEAMELDPAAPHRVFEIGGAEQTSYAGIMRAYARLRGLRRLMIPVPVLSPRLSSLWLGLVTPLFAPVGRVLIESIRNPTIVRDPAALRTFRVRPVGIDEAITAALRNEERAFAETRWSDALSATASRRKWGGVHVGSRIVDTRTAAVDAPPERAFAPIRRIGGQRGWYYGNWLWKLRGYLDLLMGGVGMRRGRRDPDRVFVGDVIDCWRVEAYEPQRRLRLQAEMRLPGRAWLEFEVEDTGAGSQIRQTAVFDPAGLTGLLYWYSLYPIHGLLFNGMLRNLAAHAQRKPETGHG